MYPRNLSDPVGLVVRMLRSGDKAAYSALVLAGLQIAAKPLDLLLLSRERRLLSRGGPLEHPIVVIVGLPRSGTTLIYQVIASAFSGSYFDNLSALFPRSTIAATSLLKRKARYSPDSFNSFYGKTSGLSGPNDAFHVWNRWFGDDHYLPTKPISPDTATAMRGFFGAWMSAFPGPIINKNNRNSLSMSVLATTLDSAFFVVVERDPVYVAQSLYQARIKIHGDPSIGWGLGTRQSPDDRPNDASRSVSDQVIRMSERMQSEIDSVPSPRLLQVGYEDFCRDPRKQIRRVFDAIQNFMPHTVKINEDLRASLPDSFPMQNRREIDEDAFLAIKKSMAAGQHA